MGIARKVAKYYIPDIEFITGTLEFGNGHQPDITVDIDGVSACTFSSVGLAQLTLNKRFYKVESFAANYVTAVNSGGLTVGLNNLTDCQSGVLNLLFWGASGSLIDPSGMKVLLTVGFKTRP
jgi:hypothetical protein